MALDQLGKTLQSFGEKAKAEVEKSAETFGVSSKIIETAKQLDGLYASLGKAVYENNAPKSLAGYEDAFESITADRMFCFFYNESGEIYPV